MVIKRFIFYNFPKSKGYLIAELFTLYDQKVSGTIVLYRIKKHQNHSTYYSPKLTHLAVMCKEQHGLQVRKIVLSCNSYRQVQIKSINSSHSYLIHFSSEPVMRYKDEVMALLHLIRLG